MKRQGLRLLRKKSNAVKRGLATLLIGFAPLGAFSQTPPATASSDGLPSGAGWHRLAEH